MVHTYHFKPGKKIPGENVIEREKEKEKVKRERETQLSTKW